MKNNHPSKKPNTDITIQGDVYRWVPAFPGRGYWSGTEDRRIRVTPPERGTGETWQVRMLARDDSVEFQVEFYCPLGSSRAQTEAFDYAAAKAGRREPALAEIGAHVG